MPGRVLSPVSPPPPQKKQEGGGKQHVTKKIKITLFTQGLFYSTLFGPAWRGGHVTLFLSHIFQLYNHKVVGTLKISTLDKVLVWEK
jgi:hypothetical protein